MPEIPAPIAATSRTARAVDPAAASPAAAAAADEAAAGTPFEFGELRNQLSSLRIALRRHGRLALAGLGLALAAAVAGLALAPRVYTARARVLIQRNEQGLNLGEPDRNFWREVQPPAQGAVDLMRARLHLERAVDDLQLVAALRAGRTPVRRALDAVRGGPSDPVAQREMTLEVLAKRVTAEATPDGTAVDVSVEWSERQTAARIAQSLVTSFLVARRDFEVGQLEARMGDIEARAEAAGAAVGTALDHARQEYARSLADTERSVRGLAANPASAAERDLARVKADLLARRQAIAEYDELQRRHRSELQARLVEQQSSLRPDHPALQETRAELAALAEEPAPLAAMRAEEKDLFERYLRRGGKDPALVETGPLRAVTEAMLAGTRLERDPALGQARAELDAAQEQWRRLRERLDAARLELDAMRASFAQRYLLVQPPRVGREPTRPNVAATLAAALAAGVALALFLALAAHAREGRLHQAWQIRRQLRLPVLAQVRALRPAGAAAASAPPQPAARPAPDEGEEARGA